jgi:hypothetical protein
MRSALTLTVFRLGRSGVGAAGCVWALAGCVSLEPAPDLVVSASNAPGTLAADANSTPGGMATSIGGVPADS